MAVKKSPPWSYVEQKVVFFHVEVRNFTDSCLMRNLWLQMDQVKLRTNQSREFDRYYLFLGETGRSSRGHLRCHSFKGPRARSSKETDT